MITLMHACISSEHVFSRGFPKHHIIFLLHVNKYAYIPFRAHAATYKAMCIYAAHTEAIFSSV